MLDKLCVNGSVLPSTKNPLNEDPAAPELMISPDFNNKGLESVLPACPDEPFALKFIDATQIPLI